MGNQRGFFNLAGFAKVFIGEFTSSDGSAFKSLIVQDPDTR